MSCKATMCGKYIVTAIVSLDQMLCVTIQIKTYSPVLSDGTIYLVCSSN